MSPRKIDPHEGGWCHSCKKSFSRLAAQLKRQHSNNFSKEEAELYGFNVCGDCGMLIRSTKFYESHCKGFVQENAHEEDMLSLEEMFLKFWLMVVLQRCKLKKRTMF